MVVISCFTYNSHTSSSFPEQGTHRLFLYFLSELSILSLLQILCSSDPLWPTIFAFQGCNLPVSIYFVLFHQLEESQIK